MLYFEDIEIGRRWKSDDFLVTREEVLAFARRWDPQPFHIDDGAAAKSVFGRLSASGVHTLALQGHLVARLEKFAILAVLELTKFELPFPVYPGDRLWLQRRVISKDIDPSHPDRGIVIAEYLVRNQDGKIVLDTHNKLLISRKPGNRK